ncbi:TetR/AcrR family transcriptional regulator C-terminal domain-containing protein [Sciscionella sediminilitoris]|uniref:TetR/AcrR family transcriptional regulator C-terminal domain-containing protein n=1 Tax=Sciscionella sediminilitoris TaxID=1445613 RepID=UPI0004DF27E4|nr:TetR/AcrR family transcriptional regulator C-terminal domain-containing protein [Sciscionella sp. SE31]
MNQTILHTAEDLLNARGLDHLTLPHLTEKLGSEPPFTDDSALRAALVEKLFTEHPFTPSRSSLAEHLRETAAGNRRIMLGCRDGARLVSEYFARSTAAMAVFANSLSFLTGAGFGRHEAALVLDTLYSYISGFVATEQIKYGFPRSRESQHDREEHFRKATELIASGARAMKVRSGDA